MPAFDLEFKVQVENGVDDAGRFYSDFFYSNFKNASHVLEDFNLYKNFKEKLGINFTAEWPVARLPLKKGEFAPYLARVEDYASMEENKPFGGFVNFSSPIFATTLHPDDFAFFLKERLDQEFNILSSKEYRLYGNQAGYYPIDIEVLGDLTAENLVLENKSGIREFIINGHGQWDNIDQCVFKTEDKESEKRISFLNMGNINDTLAHNYYHFYLWTCNNAYQLNANNLIHEAMANGLCLSALAASSILSNSGVDKRAAFAELQQNNHFYFHLNYFFHRALGQSRSKSFALAKRAYIQVILENTHLIKSSNYQFNLHNVLSYHYLGVLEYWEHQPKKKFRPLVFSKARTARLSAAQSGSSRVFDGEIDFTAQYYNDSFRVLDFTAARSACGVEFTLEYKSAENNDLSFFDPPNGEVVKKIWFDGIKKGSHGLSWEMSKEETRMILNLNRITMLVGFENRAAILIFDPRQLKNLLE